MSTRVSLASVLLAYLLLACAQLQAQVPAHVEVETFGPAAEDFRYPDVFPPEEPFFGFAVSMRNETAFIGMPRAHDSEGRVAIFQRTTSGWQRTGTLKASDATAGGNFGTTISYRDSTVVVSGRGLVYVFRLASGVWKQTARIAVPNDTESPWSGPSLRYQDGLVVYGAPRRDAPGEVHLIQLASDGRFASRAVLRAADRRNNDGFGAGVAMSRNTVVVGAPGAGTEGAAYVFRRSSSSWWEAQKLVPTDPRPDTGFGESVAINNDVVVVGAPGAEPVGSYYGNPTTPEDYHARGAAYVFGLASTGRYVQQARLRPTFADEPYFTVFGSSIEMSDNRIAIAAEVPDFGVSRIPPGFVFTYVMDGAGVRPLGKASVSEVPNSIALANNWLLVGTPFDDRCGIGACIGMATLFDVSRFR